MPLVECCGERRGSFDERNEECTADQCPLVLTLTNFVVHEAPGAILRQFCCDKKRTPCVGPL